MQDPELPPFLPALVSDIIGDLVGEEQAVQATFDVVIHEFLMELYMRGYAIHEVEEPVEQTGG